IDFARSLRPHGVQYNILDLLVGTPLWDDLRTKGVVKEEDWKTNHRVFEYFPENASQAELESLVKDGYGAFMDAWKSLGGVKELLHVLMVNPTARSIIFGNLTNP